MSDLTKNVSGSVRDSTPNFTSLLPPRIGAVGSEDQEQ